ncbi:MAG: hypothetical protein KIT83_05205 [Bryobacterales bacterium]|nr:hypothetical protein [Bryobacterales bacterium]
MKLLIALCLSGLWMASGVAQDVLPRDHQIAGAVLAAPEELRATATVLGYNASHELVPLRESAGDLVCLASDPRREAFNVACYHKDLEPFMARGRELAKQGVSGQKRNDIRYEEIKAGNLELPKEPRMLYVLTGSKFDPASGQVEKSYLRWVVYTPYATQESTGLSTKPAEGSPWLMFPGTPGAHIMISPPRPK